jgi:hypothetical protein
VTTIGTGRAEDLLETVTNALANVFAGNARLLLLDQAVEVRPRLEAVPA